MALNKSVLLLLLFALLFVQASDKGLRGLIRDLESSDDTTKKEALIALEQRASYGEYAVGEQVKRGAVPLVLKILAQEYGNPLVKERAVSLLSKMITKSSQVGNLLAVPEFLNHVPTLLRRGTVTAQENALSILLQLSQDGLKHLEELAGIAIIDAVVYVLGSGTPVARERAAGLVALYALDETAHGLFESLNVEDVLIDLSNHGATNGVKKAAVAALRKLALPDIAKNAKAAIQTASTSSLDILASFQAASASPSHASASAATATATATATSSPASASASATISTPTSKSRLSASAPRSQTARASARVFSATEKSESSADDLNAAKPPPKKILGFVNNYRLRAPARSSHY